MTKDLDIMFTTTVTSSTTTHQVQSFVVAFFLLFDVLVLFVLNKWKKSNFKKKNTIPWAKKRNMYWALIFSLVVLSCTLDVYFEISALLIPLKAYVLAFPVGLLDLYFSDTKGVPMQVIAGAGLWCFCTYIRMFMANAYLGKHYLDEETRVVSGVFTNPVGVLGIEALRYVVSLIGVGMFSDLIFSPMHRLCHHYFYKAHHKIHHEYTNKITSLVLYHGALLDDFIMPLTTSFGGFIYICLLANFGLETQAFSNLTGYIVIFNTLMSHAHDTRCARLMAPLPDDLNFVAYHYVHHLSPMHNFGLTKPSDIIWDRLLGVNTIRTLDDFHPDGRMKKQK